jgi:hypothetical protein
MTAFNPIQRDFASKSFRVSRNFLSRFEREPHAFNKEQLAATPRYIAVEALGPTKKQLEDYTTK